jgi:uncharacterized membrane protein YphA (DoxX/SURF4 family)
LSESVATTIAFAARLSVAVVLLAAGISKVRQPRKFSQQLAAYSLIPTRLVSIVSYAVIGMELALGLALLLGVAVLLALGASFGLLLVFGFAISVSLLRRRSNACGCFGGDEAVSVRSLARVALLVTAVLGAATIQYSSASHAWPVGGHLVVGFGLAGLLLVVGSFLLSLPEAVVVLRIARD